MEPKRARLAKKVTSDRVQCRLCHHFCILADGQRGFCGVRMAEKGELFTLVGNGIAATHVDPIEKKPLYHYLPGTGTFSIGTSGCNFDCVWCQNHSMSRSPAETGQIRSFPTDGRTLANAALFEDCASMAFTYNEPTVFFELLTDTTDEALALGLGTVLVSNGYQSPDCLSELENRIQAANIDLKTFSDATSRRFCKARLQPVLDNLKTMKRMGWWVEVTTLVIPGINDDPAELRDMARFLKNEMGPETPWHISAFHPCRKMTDRSPTPPETLLETAEIGLEEGLFFVYPGNVPPPFQRSTLCPACQAELVSRRGFRALPVPAFDGTCPTCGHTLPGIWNKPNRGRKATHTT